MHVVSRQSQMRATNCHVDVNHATTLLISLSRTLRADGKGKLGYGACITRNVPSWRLINESTRDPRRGAGSSEVVGQGGNHPRCRAGVFLAHVFECVPECERVGCEHSHLVRWGGHVHQCRIVRRSEDI